MTLMAQPISIIIESLLVWCLIVLSAVSLNRDRSYSECVLLLVRGEKDRTVERSPQQSDSRERHNITQAESPRNYLSVTQYPHDCINKQRLN